jgi:hypothetical protein
LFLLASNQPHICKQPHTIATSDATGASQDATAPPTIASQFAHAGVLS